MARKSKKTIYPGKQIDKLIAGLKESSEYVTSKEGQPLEALDSEVVNMNQPVSQTRAQMDPVIDYYTRSIARTMQRIIRRNIA